MEYRIYYKLFHRLIDELSLIAEQILQSKIIHSRSTGIYT